MSGGPAFLASIQPMAPHDVEPTILRATGGIHPLDVTFIDDEDLATPWKRAAVTAMKLPGTMPQALNITLANLVYFEKSALPQALANRLIRLAAFQNPEFYKAQAMRLSVWDKPRVIGNAENYPQHIALPRGCLDAALALLKDNGIRCDLQDERYGGEPVDVGFAGTLRTDQALAVSAMLQHDAGVLCAPTAFGKTVVAAAIIARRGVNTLVLVHRTALLKQWQERLQTFLDMDASASKSLVGTIGGGKARPTGRVDIAVMQSLAKVSIIQRWTPWYWRCRFPGKARCSITRAACTGNTPARPMCASSTSSTPATRRCCGCGTSGSGAIARWDTEWQRRRSAMTAPLRQALEEVPPISHRFQSFRWKVFRINDL